MPRGKRQGKKNFKKNFKKNRARVVETKRREDAFTSIRNSNNGAGVTFSSNYPDATKLTQTSATQSITLLPLRSFYRMSQGNRKDQMESNQIMAKTLYMKGIIETAHGTGPIYLVTGMVQDKLGLTDFTVPTSKAATRTDLEAFVEAQVKQHFDEKKDELRYREAKKDNIKIHSYQRLLNPDTVLPDNQQGLPVHFKAHWNMNRKVTYTKGTSLPGNNDLIQNSSLTPGVTIDMTDTFKESTDSVGGDISNYYPNFNWLPFACFYIPDAMSDDGVNVTYYQFKYNNILYFTG